MPLKKPDKLPKIPKTRKKKAETALNSVPEKKPDKLEYICKAFFKYDKTTKEQLYVLAVETIAEFTSFAYELSIEVIEEKKEIYLVLMGLSAKANMAPSIEPARTDLVFHDLMGEYTVYVVKQDGAINAGVFNFNIYSKEIKLEKEYLPEKENNRLFCQFNVSEEEFSFPEAN